MTRSLPTPSPKRQLGGCVATVLVVLFIGATLVGSLLINSRRGHGV